MLIPSWVVHFLAQDILYLLLAGRVVGQTNTLLISVVEILLRDLLFLKTLKAVD
jgi:hypothetical protein